jgi:hypothetical protein
LNKKIQGVDLVIQEDKQNLESNIEKIILTTRMCLNEFGIKGFLDHILLSVYFHQIKDLVSARKFPLNYNSFITVI